MNDIMNQFHLQLQFFLKQFKYFGEQDPILENKSQQIKPEVTNQPTKQG